MTPLRQRFTEEMLLRGLSKGDLSAVRSCTKAPGTAPIVCAIEVQAVAQITIQHKTRILYLLAGKREELKGYTLQVDPVRLFGHYQCTLDIAEILRVCHGAN